MNCSIANNKKPCCVFELTFEKLLNDYFGVHNYLKLIEMDGLQRILYHFANT